ncbi:sensor histidine kinase [Cellulomonas fengjieae]|uniref:sensor histidine kinase n=1 Tax=Cellulomonas fengjieae TaxID=2819978 RepID=UPI001AAFBA64|nr:histidine kinase [Cellulomonas fengjieae]MBO3101509.1 two-component sensor histidine kinase [Cellulomonas fengjieae]
MTLEPGAPRDAPRPAAVTAAAGRVGAHVGRFLRRPAVAHVLVVGGFTAWALLMGLGADSMYWLSEHLDSAQVLRMQLACVVLTAAGATALCWRRSRPVVVAAAVGTLAIASLLATGATNGFEIGLAIALCSVAVARPVRDVWLTAAAVVLPVALVAWAAPLVRVLGTRVIGRDPGDPAALRSPLLPGALADAVTPAWLVTVVPVVVLVLLGIACGTLLRNRRLRLAALAEAAQARAAEQEQRARLTQADERARVAREMHDVVAHSITVMVALGGGAAAALDRAPDQSRLALKELVETGRTALDDVRRILGVLHAAEHTAEDAAGTPGGTAERSSDSSSEPAPMEPQPGTTDLPRLVERFRTAGLPVRTRGLAVTGLDGPACLDATAQLAVFRIVQESLTNALRHAPGTAGVDVEVRRTPGAVEVVVTDQGPGQDVAPTPGTRRGIVGMTERVAAFGGTVEAGPYGPGWRVRAQIPQPNDEGEA